MFEYDEEGKVVNETQTSSIQTWTTTVHTDIGEDGKPTGGFIEKTRDVIFEILNMEQSGKEVAWFRMTRITEQPTASRSTLRIAMPKCS